MRLVLLVRRQVPSLGLIFSFWIFKLEALSDCISVPWASRHSNCSISISILLRTKGDTRKLCPPVQTPALWLGFISIRLQPWLQNWSLLSLFIFPYPGLSDHFSLPIGKFARGDEGGVFVLLGDIFLSRICHKNIKKIVVSKTTFGKHCWFFQRAQFGKSERIWRKFAFPNEHWNSKEFAPSDLWFLQKK